jgi:3-oxocholest-4-en-26-oyl-CoA dehydrogenase alpha subunit
MRSSTDPALFAERVVTEEEQLRRDDFRRALREFLEEELTENRRRKHLDEQEYGGWAPDYIREFRMKLGALGFIGVGWPEEFGGGGKGMVYEVILADELEYSGAPGLDRTITYLPQAIISFGTDEQKALLLPRLRRGEIALCTAYSEPEAGSDLASLRLAAEPVPGGFSATGQKEYCSQAHIADYAILAARTSTTGRKHEGISLFIVDMHDEKIAISRHKTVAGWYHHSVYFDGVEIPASMLLGELHNGWSVLMGAVDHERAALSAPGEVSRQFDRLMQWALTPRPDGVRPIDDLAVAEPLADLSIDQRVARAYAYELAERVDADEDVGSDGSLAQLLKREASRKADNLGLDLLGSVTQITRGSEHAVLEGHIEYESRDHLYYSFAAGGFDIIRNVIARRTLDLPRAG